MHGQQRAHRGRKVWRLLPGAVLCALAVQTAFPVPSTAQTNNSGIEIRGPIDDVPQLKDILPDFNTTIVPRQAPDTNVDTDAVSESQISLVAQMTRESKAPIGGGLVWRIFSVPSGTRAQPKLVRTLTEAAPSFSLPPGIYYVNAAFGRANLTRRITVLERGRLREVFVINAGGLRADVGISGGSAPDARSVSINIYSEESDQSGQRQLIVRNARPGRVIRLNAGIYHLESRVGRANAFVKSEVSIEAGKLTVARILHEAAVVTFRLVATAGGEA
ncbi:MAG: hypothetical protein AAFY64_10620, partial [Pseudomonadota bacterium]